MKEIKDFCVSSNANGFDEFLKVLKEYFKLHLSGRTQKYYGVEDGIFSMWSSIPNVIEVAPQEAIALLTGKQLTEGDLIVGNRFECIEDIINGREGVSFTKGEKYKCELDKSITNNFGYPQYTFKDSEYLNRHFKLLPTQESVKEIDTFIADHDKLSLKMANEEISHLQQQLNTLTSEIKRLQEKYDENGYDSPPTIQLQRIEQHVDSALGHWVQQLKEAKELITQIDFHLNYYGQIDEDTQIQINQFLTHNK